MQQQFLLVETSVLPEVFIKVMKAKGFLASGKAKNVSEAAKLADISRSAFYKYKDSVFAADSASDIVTVTVVLLDEKGALQTLLAALSDAGANVVTINQAQPANGTAALSVTMRITEMREPLDEVLVQLKRQRTVVDVKRNA